jgi:hypothetical protein
LKKGGKKNIFWGKNLIRRQEIFWGLIFQNFFFDFSGNSVECRGLKSFRQKASENGPNFIFLILRINTVYKFFFFTPIQAFKRSVKRAFILKNFFHIKNLGGLKEVTGKGGSVQGLDFFFFRFVQFRLENLEQKNNSSSFSVQAFFVIVLSILKSGAEKSKDV